MKLRLSPILIHIPLVTVYSTRNVLSYRMATKYTEHRATDPFLRLEKLIYDTFDKIIKTATDRRNEVLGQLEEFKTTFLRMEVAREKRLKELEDNLQLISKANTRTQEKRMIKEKQEMYDRPYQCPIPILITEHFQSLLQQIEAFGHVQGTAGPYVNKTKHFGSFGKRGAGRGELSDPKGLALDGENRVYVADFLNQRVQIFSQDKSFLSEFGNKVLFRPFGIALFDKYVFVSDRQLGIVFKFVLSSYKLVCKSGKGKLDSPSGIAVDQEEVFVADRCNNRVVVMSSELKILREIGQYMLNYPQDVKVNKNKIFIADNSKHRNIHIFSKTGDFLKSIIKLENGNRDIFFTFDSYDSILISDFGGSSIQIFSFDGRLVHRIASEPNPTGIAVRDSFHIITARHFLWTSDVRLY